MSSTCCKITFLFNFWQIDVDDLDGSGLNRLTLNLGPDHSGDHTLDQESGG